MTTTTLTRETIKPEVNGDRFWERPFNEDETIQRLKSFEGRGTEFKVKSGLELLRVKENLPHGQWYGFLYRAQISPDKAQRRMRLARQFMHWVRVEDVVKAMDLKPCKLQDFASEANQKVNLNDFLEKGYTPNDLKPIYILRVSLSKLEKVMVEILNRASRDYPTWTAIEKQEAKDTLQIFADRLIDLKKHIEELEVKSAEEQMTGVNSYMCKIKIYGWKVNNGRRRS